MKIFNYTILMVVLILFLKFAGIPIGGQAFLNAIGFDVAASSMKSATFYTGIFGAAGILLAIGVGIAVGFLTKSKPENYIILPLIVGSLEFFVVALTSIIDYSLTNFAGWVSSIIILIFAPLVVGYVLSLVEFFRGTD